jgi:hypothetical protein
MAPAASAEPKRTQELMRNAPDITTGQVESLDIITHSGEHLLNLINVVTGVSASQQMRVLIPWDFKKYGPNIYIVGPDYNFGTISGIWVHLTDPMAMWPCGPSRTISGKICMLPAAIAATALTSSKHTKP